ncbi:MAG TPA: CoA transferase subunit A [Thermoplasmata archaeon]|nr:CoA transferase subunit A [Thermoplasmata archaeon]
MNIIESGKGEIFCKNTPSQVRDWTRENKNRALVDKRMSAKEAVRRFIKDEDYLAIGGFGHVRIPMSIIYEIVRQGISELSVAGHTAVHDLDVLIAGDCVKNVDVAYVTGYELRGLSANQRRAYESGKINLTEWTNGALAWRLKAGAMGVPFIPAKTMLGTDTFKYSAGKVARCPFTGEKVVLLPALCPDVTICHVHRCDIHGNAQIDGATVKDELSTKAAKRVILTTEEIVETEEIRREPWRTTIPYYYVDAVVEVPWGSHPCNMPRKYYFDEEFINDYLKAAKKETSLSKWMEKFVYSVKDFNQYLDLIGRERLLALRDLEFLRTRKKEVV